MYNGQTSTRLKLMTAPLVNPMECITKYGQLYDEHFCTGSQNSQSVCTVSPILFITMPCHLHPGVVIYFFIFS